MSVTLLANLEKTYGVERIFEENYYKSRVFATDIIEFIEFHEENINLNVIDELTHNESQILQNKLNKLKKYEGLQYNYFNIMGQGSLNKAVYMDYPAYILIDESGVEAYPLDIIDNLDRYYSFRKVVQEIEPGEYNCIYLGLTDAYLQDKLSIWQLQKTEINRYVYAMIGLALGCLIAFIILAALTGRKTFQDKKIYLGFSDTLYNDMNVFLCVCIIAVWVQISSYFFFVYDNIEFLIPALFAETFVFGCAVLTLFLSLIRHIKNKTIVKHTLVSKGLHKTFLLIKEIYIQGNMGRKTVYIVVGYSLILLIAIFFPVNIFYSFYIPPSVLILQALVISVPIGLALWQMLKKVKDYKAIKEGIEEIKKGNYYHRIEIASKGELKVLAENINNINQGLSQAVDNKLKSERLKTELITNVSHDIRTPLTSIITYVDLLKKEEDTAKKEKYIEVIEQKSLRLKSLTDDLFEASKASTGNINANSEKIDIESLITQGLGELHEKIEERGYDIRVNYPEEKVFANADGKLLWRVIENLLSNILKYSLKGSRVYIDVENHDKMISICFKNISEHELNIPVDELIERFKRGDESRGSDGSGLGLSIAKSLTEIQNGKLHLEIHGDLFAATIEILQYEEAL